MKFIEIDYIIDGKKFTEKLDIDLKFSQFIMIVEVTHNISMQFFEVFHYEQKLGQKFFSYQIKDIIRTNDRATFNFKRVKNFNDNDLTTKKNLIKELKLVEIQIVNYTSCVEITDILDDILEREKFNKQFKYISTDDSIIITVSGMNKGLDLFHKLSLLKNSNKAFSSVDISLKIRNKEKSNHDSKKIWEKTNLYNTLMVSLNFIINYFYICITTSVFL
jgi:hypothetical protein